MTELFLFGPQIVNVGFPWRYFQRNPLDDFQTVALQANDFARIVGQQTQLSHSQIAQNLSADAVVAQIFFKAQFKVRFHRIAALILQSVRLDLIREADASSFLMHVDQNPFTLLIDQSQGLPYLVPAVATFGTKYIARETL